MSILPLLNIKKLKGEAPNSVVCCLLPALGIGRIQYKEHASLSPSWEERRHEDFETHRPKKATFMPRD